MIGRRCFTIHNIDAYDTLLTICGPPLDFRSLRVTILTLKSLVDFVTARDCEDLSVELFSDFLFASEKRTQKTFKVLWRSVRVGRLSLRVRYHRTGIRLDNLRSGGPNPSRWNRRASSVRLIFVIGASGQRKAGRFKLELNDKLLDILTGALGDALPVFDRRKTSTCKNDLSRLRRFDVAIHWKRHHFLGHLSAARSTQTPKK